MCLILLSKVIPRFKTTKLISFSSHCSCNHVDCKVDHQSGPTGDFHDAIKIMAWRRTGAPKEKQKML